MDVTVVNPYVMKILIAAKTEDTIFAIASRTGLSYGWAYHWVQDLIELGAFSKKGRKIELQEDNAFYRSSMSFLKANFAKNVSFHYSVLQLFGVKYCFTKTDAVYVWTKGGYNIARYRDYYPVFIKLRKSDYGLFRWYCKKLGLKIGPESGIFYSVELLDDFPVSSCDGISVDGLEDTVAFMEKNAYNFQPALEMIGEMYKASEGHYKYREEKTNYV